MHLIDGRELARKIKDAVKQEIAKSGLTPGLSVILVGANSASHLYVALKERAAREAGIRFEKYLFFAAESEDKVILKIKDLNARPDIHAILVQLPLPAPMSEDRVIAAIDPAKDVDGFHPENLKLLHKHAAPVVPGVSLGILRLIQSTGLPLRGKRAVILANSTVFAEPLEVLFHEKEVNALSIIRPTQDEARQWTRDADIIVIAVGQAGFLQASMVKDGAIVIDVGANKKDTGELVGDADLTSFHDRDVWITPVPGGVGPVTVAMLLTNVLRCSGSL